MIYYIITAKIGIGRYRQEILSEHDEDILEDVLELTRDQFEDVHIDQVDVPDSIVYSFLTSSG